MNNVTKIKVVQTGCGNMAAAWIKPALQITQLEYVGLVDPILANAKKIAKQFSFSKDIIFTTLSEALEKTQPDVVFDVSVPSAHFEITTQALQHGCHVLGEKPMSDTLENARKMVQAARQANKIYAVIQNRRYEPNILRVQDFLDSGAIGQPHTVHADFFLGPHFGGFRDAMEQPLLVDMAIHTFDAARCLARLDPVTVSQLSHEAIKKVVLFLLFCQTVIDQNLSVDKEKKPHHVKDYCISPGATIVFPI